MAEQWTAEVDISAEIAGAVLREQFPQLAVRKVEPFGEGWDNAAFLVDDAVVFRFPRRAVAVELIEIETRVLPAIAPRVPLAIPVPVYAGAPSERFEWPFAGYALLAGTPLSFVAPDEAQHVAVAAAMGAFLRALHAIDPDALPGPRLEPDKIGRLDHSTRRPLLRRRFAELHKAGLLDDPAPFLEFLDEVSPQGPRERLTVVHGDLYARHVLVDDALRACGVIDWGDVHLGDPALDLSFAFEVLPPAARASFAEAYGPIDDQTWLYARYRAIYHAALVAHYGHRIGAHDLETSGLAGLRQSLA